MGSLYNKNYFLHTYISRLQLDIILSATSKLGSEWTGENQKYLHDKLYFIEEGTCFINIDGTDYYPTENQMILLPRGCNVTFAAVNNREFTKSWCIFDANIHDVSFFDIVKTPLYVTSGNPKKIKELFCKLNEVNLKSDIISAILSKAYLTEIIAEFISDCDKVSHISVNEFDPFMSEIMEYIDTHFSENIGINEMAKHMNFHPKYFGQLFKQKFGITPAKYLKQLRIEKSMYMLLHTDNSIENIMYLCGFNNKSLFTKDFKEFTGSTPKTYRTMFKNTVAGKVK